MKKILTGLLLSLVVVFGCTKGDAKVLTIATWDGGGGDFLKEIVKSYEEENPDLKIELEVVESNQYDRILKIRNTANQLPDVFATRVTTMQDYKNITIPLDDLRAAKESPYADLYKLGGHIMGIPMLAFREYVYYRKSIFAELELTIPQTWDEYLEVIKVIKNNGKYIPLALGAKDPWSVYPYNVQMSFLEKGGDNFQDQMAEDETPFSPGKPFYEAYKKVDALYQLKPSGNDPLGYGNSESQDMFIGKKAAMLTLGQWFYEKSTTMDDDVRKDVGAFFLPVRDSKEDPFRILLSAEAFLSIPEYTDNQVEANDFINYVFDNIGNFEGYGSLISPEGASSSYQLFKDALTDVEGKMEDVLIIGGGEKYKKIVNKLQFDMRAMGQEMLLGADFEELMASYNDKWQKAVLEINEEE